MKLIKLAVCIVVMLTVSCNQNKSQREQWWLMRINRLKSQNQALEKKFIEAWKYSMKYPTTAEPAKDPLLISESYEGVNLNDTSIGLPYFISAQSGYAFDTMEVVRYENNQAKLRSIGYALKGYSALVSGKSQNGLGNFLPTTVFIDLDTSMNLVKAVSF